MVRPRLTKVRFDGDRVFDETTLVDGLGRIRDVHVGHDGFVYLAINRGERTVADPSA